jgi:hypothetical protein
VLFSRQPDPALFLDIGRVHANTGRFKRLRKWHKRIIGGSGRTTTAHHNLFIKAYARAQPPLPQSAREEFERLIEGGNTPDRQTFHVLHMALGGEETKGESLVEICERLGVALPKGDGGSEFSALRDWRCPRCAKVNWWHRAECYGCGLPVSQAKESQV